jgi:hypothetical protein
MSKVESRSLYVVTRPFTAYILQSEEGFAQQPYAIEAGWELSADLEHWKGWRWERVVAVQFLHGASDRLYVDRETFLESTQKQKPSAQKKRPSGRKKKP